MSRHALIAPAWRQAAAGAFVPLKLRCSVVFFVSKHIMCLNTVWLVFRIRASGAALAFGRLKFEEKKGKIK